MKGYATPLLTACVATSALWLLARTVTPPAPEHPGAGPTALVPAPDTDLPIATAPTSLSVPPPGSSGPETGTPARPPGAAAAAPRLLAVNRRDNTLALVDSQSLRVIGRVRTGAAPRGVAVSSDGHFAYVASGSARQPGSLSVIDVGRARVFSKVDLGLLRRPGQVLAAGRDIYFTAPGTGSVARYNAASGKVDWLMGVGSSGHDLAYSAPAGKLYAAGNGLLAVSTLDQAPAVSDLPVPASPRGVAVSPDGGELWVSHRDRSRLSVFDTRSHRLKAEVTLPAGAAKLDFTPDGRCLIASSARGEEVMLLDVAGKKPVRRVNVGGHPAGVVVTPDSKTAFVSTPEANRVVRVDLDRLTVTGSVHTGDGPEALALAVPPMS